jgi:hypothetical protein
LIKSRKSVAEFDINTQEPCGYLLDTSVRNVSVTWVGETSLYIASEGAQVRVIIMQVRFSTPEHSIELEF